MRSFDITPEIYYNLLSQSSFDRQFNRKNLDLTKWNASLMIIQSSIPSNNNEVMINICSIYNSSDIQKIKYRISGPNQWVQLNFIDISSLDKIPSAGEEHRKHVD